MTLEDGSPLPPSLVFDQTFQTLDVHYHELKKNYTLNIYGETVSKEKANTKARIEVIGNYGPPNFVTNLERIVMK